MMEIMMFLNFIAGIMVIIGLAFSGQWRVLAGLSFLSILFNGLIYAYYKWDTRND